MRFLNKIKRLTRKETSCDIRYYTSVLQICPRLLNNVCGNCEVSFKNVEKTVKCMTETVDHNDISFVINIVCIIGYFVPGIVET